MTEKQKQLTKDLTYDKVREMYLEKEYKFFEGMKSLNIFGIRLAVDSDKYDDLIGVAYREEGTVNGKVGIVKHLKLYPATTDPGKYWLNNPMNKKGCAILVPGQYLGSHMIGTHSGYTALVQKSSVKVYRDNDKDNEHDMDIETIDTGVFGINIHRSHPFNETYDINKYSAGCQVFQNSAEFNELMNLCWAQARIKEMGNSFSYTLFISIEPSNSEVEKTEVVTETIVEENRDVTITTSQEE